MSVTYMSVLESSGGGGLQVDNLAITTPASKLTYTVGESFSIAGLVVTATIGSLVGNVTQDCTFSPSVGTQFTLSDLGYSNVTIQYGGETLTYQIRVKQGVELVPWATGTDAQIAEMLEAHYAGDINIYACDGWEIGAERTVSLGDTGLTYPVTSGTLVLMDKGGKELTEAIGSNTECAYVVGFKELLGESKIRTDSNWRSWDTSDLVSLLNSTTFNALPQGIKSILKSFKVPYTKLLDTSGNNELRYMDSYLAVPSFSEVYGTTWVQSGNTYNANIEGAQFEYYTTASNRIKKRNTSISPWWTRTCATFSGTGIASNNSFAQVKTDGTYGSEYSNLNRGISPFGVI